MKTLKTPFFKIGYCVRDVTKGGRPRATDRMLPSFFSGGRGRISYAIRFSLPIGGLRAPI